ncbi:hypothetical protein DID75_04615 [Candidatus Marinamargulisbacteria bacterium SCGC AG-410-N11]|nr:hypothetical protein DID75_04615 [Candidatus Marinamargulisbacteria bacterium SCGC AG-410-N11]
MKQKTTSTIFIALIFLINILGINIIVANQAIITTPKHSSSTRQQTKSTITGYKVMKKVKEQARKYETRIGKVKISIIDKKKRQRERYFRLYKKFFPNEEDRSLIKFFRPANVKGMALLSKSINSVTRQWLYMPAFKSTKLLSSQDQNKSFMGSDFTYSDIAGRQLDQDKHKLVKETDKFYYIESKPKNPTEFYSKMQYVISKTQMAVLKVIFYDNNQKKLKTLSNKTFKQYKDIFLAVDSFMENHQTNGSTRLLIEEISIGNKIANETVGLKGLKQ